MTTLSNISSCSRKPISTPLSPPKQGQSGGTVLGVIVGLIVGLSIAVVVALMISKTSLPFTNKRPQAERSGNSGTPGSNNAVVDPNKPLYGNKEPARQAAKNYTPEAAAENAPASDAKPAVAEKTPSDKSKAAEKAIADARVSARSAEKANANAAVQTSDKPGADKAGNGDEKWTYFLQAGAFRDPTDAENAKAKLALMGFEANVSERASETGPLYRVRVGPFAQLETMTRARGKLSDNGVDVAVVRSAR